MEKNDEYIVLNEEATSQNRHQLCPDGLNLLVPFVCRLISKLLALRCFENQTLLTALSIGRRCSAHFTHVELIFND